MVMTKRVNIRTTMAVRNINPPICGTCNNVIMSTGDILKCLCRRAFVEEILPDGTTVRLNMKNYYTDNGAGLDATKKVEVVKEPEVEVIPAVEDPEEVIPAAEESVEEPVKEKTIEESVVEPEAESVDEPVKDETIEESEVEVIPAVEEPEEVIPAAEESVEEPSTIEDDVVEAASVEKSVEEVVVEDKKPAKKTSNSKKKKSSK